MQRKWLLSLLVTVVVALGLVAFRLPAPQPGARVSRPGAAHVSVNPQDATAVPTALGQAGVPTPEPTADAQDTTQSSAAIILIWAVVIIVVAITLFLIWWTRPARKAQREQRR